MPDARTRITLGLGIPALSGLALGLAMPRGPVTAAQALVVLVSGLAVGAAAGYALRSRWAMLLAPIAHVAVFELARLGAQGPTIDGIHLGVVGIMAFIAGRGFHGLVGLFPMVVGAAYGARLARGTYRPHAVTAISMIGVVALAALIVRPATTPPILGPDGEPLPGSIATLAKVNLGGHDGWISIRDYSVLAVQQRPDLYYAYIGSGQMVSERETDRLLYDDMLAWADDNDEALAETLRKLGPPPYDDVGRYSSLLVTDWERVYPFDWPSDAEDMNVLRGLADTFDVLYPQLQGIDFRRDVTKLEVPVYLVQGKYEMAPRAQLVPEWFDLLDAPSKRLVVFQHSAHNPYNSEFARFHDFMTDTVLAETYPGS